MKFWHLAKGHNCRVCRYPLIPVVGQEEAGVHPMCDKSDRVWWGEEERAVWLAERTEKQG